MGLSSWSLDHIAFSWRVIPKAFRIKDPWESWNYQKAVCGQAQDIFDNPTPFDPRKHVFHHHTRTGDEGIEELILHAQGLALRFFFGCRLRTPSGSSPCKPVSLSSVAWTGEAIW